MIEKPAMLVPRDDQHALEPMRRVSDRFVDRFDQGLAQRDTIRGMLRVVHKRLVQRLRDRVVSRLDERISGIVGRFVDVAGEVREVVDVVVNADPGKQADLRERIPGINAEWDISPPQGVEDRAVLKRDSGARLARGLLGEDVFVVVIGGRIVPHVGIGSVDEHPVRLGRAGHRAEPVIAKHKLFRERREDRKCAGREAAHRFAWVR